jgi:hypothetical protein
LLPLFPFKVIHRHMCKTGDNSVDCVYKRQIIWPIYVFYICFT